MNERVIKRLILIIVILILAIAGVFAYLYFGTDLLKSEEQLFYKYFGKALEIENSDKLAEYINKRLTNNYEITGKYKHIKHKKWILASQNKKHFSCR